MDSNRATSGLIRSTQEMEFNRRHSGPIRAATTNRVRIDSHTGPGSFREKSAILDQAGVYTLILGPDIPTQDFKNETHSASATLNAVYFEVIPVPEHSAVYPLFKTIGLSALRQRLGT